MITNFLSVLEFRAVIQRLPNVEFTIQRTSIPSISSNPPEQGNPFGKTFYTPDKLDYGALDFSFIVDSDMNNYIEVFNWITAITFPQEYNQFKEIEKSKEGLYSDISVLLLSEHKNPKIRFNYINCFPIALSELNLDTTANGVDYPQATVSFKYDYFTIDKL